MSSWIVRVFAGMLGASLLWSAAQAAEVRFEPAALREDFQALYEGLQQTHYDLYARTPKAGYDRLYAKTLAGLDHPLTALEARQVFQRFVAAGHVAHARIDYLLEAFGAYRSAGGKAFPLTVRVVDGKVFVSEVPKGVTGLAVGDEITAVNGVGIGDLLVRIRANISADTTYMSDSLVELDMTPWLWIELGPVESFKVAVWKAGGSATVQVPAMTRDAVRAASAAAPLHIDVTERVSRMLPGGVAYLRPGIFMNLDPGADPYDPTAFKAFIDKAFADYLKAGATTLVIDLRDNPGGHNAFSDPMIAGFADRPFRFFSQFKVRASRQAVASNDARLAAGEPGRIVSQQLAGAYAKAKAPGAVVDLEGAMVHPRAGERFRGRVFVLVNRRSYSNSVAVAALVQDYKFGKVIGEATSDLATTFGAMEQFKLPNTGILVGYPKAYIVRPSGDLAPDGVTPDIKIAAPIFEGADDPVLAAALKAIAP